MRTRTLARFIAAVTITAGAPLVTPTTAGAIGNCVYLTDHNEVCPGDLLSSAPGVPDADADSYPYIPPIQATMRGIVTQGVEAVNGVIATVNQYSPQRLPYLTSPMCTDGGCGGKTSPPPPEFDRLDDFCTANYNDGHIHMYGCWTAWAERYDRNAAYDWYVWEFHLSGGGTNGHHIYRLKARTEATDSGVNITHWSPDTNDRDTGTPSTVHAGFKLGGEGFEINFGTDFQLYPGKLHSYVAPTLYHTSWEDQSGGGTGSNVEVGGGIEIRVAQGSPSNVNLLAQGWED